MNSIRRPLIIFRDNLNVVKYAQNNYITNDNKHINLKYHCVIDYVERKLIDIAHRSTLENITDLLIKELSVTTFQGHRAGMRILESFSLLSF